MRVRRVGLCVAVLSVLPIPWMVRAASRLSARPAEEPYGLDRRVPWTTSRIKGSPEPPPPFRTENAFPKLKFNEPLDMQAAPASDRLFVVERYGKIYSFPNDPNVAHAELFLEAEPVAYGFALHPQFEQNGFCFVTYVIDKEKELPLGTRVSRFRVSQDDKWRCDPKSEQILIEWPSGGHNGGCLRFGPDGMLYIATGDASGIADEHQTGQDLGTLAGKILRIDVNRADAGKQYGVPKDNPFVGVDGARPEIWAYGLRQPWKISFDLQTGELWTGNVGQDLWEQIYRIERGGNYGWSVMEGSRPFRPERKRGPSPVLMPIVEHSHADFRSITGGFVYRGTRLKELVGAYVYGDYDTGRIWMLRCDTEKSPPKVAEHRELFKSKLRLVGFAEDRTGELFLVDHMGGGIHRLVANAASSDSVAAFPRKLSDTGLFTSVKDHKTAPGVIPYSISAPAWADGAIKEWFIALPGDSQIEFEAIEFPQPAPGAHLGWKFPDGGVVVETISLPTSNFQPGRDAGRSAGNSLRRVETRILHCERLTGTEEVGDQYWRGYTFVWNDEQSDATLMDDPQGRDRTFTIRDPAAPGGQRQLAWHIPSRAECISCHNMAAKYLLGVTTAQMNKDYDYSGRTDNQLGTFEHIGLFTKPLPKPPAELPRLADYRDDKQPLDRRARAYLEANCSYCHRKWGGGNAEFQLLASLELADTKAVGVSPGQGSFFIPDAQVIAPGEPYRSVAFYRMAKLGPGRMPRAGSNEVDSLGVRLIHDWISQLSPNAGRADDAAPERTRATQYALLNMKAALAIESLKLRTSKTVDHSMAINRLLETTSGALRLVAAIDSRSLSDAAAKLAIERGSQHADAHIRELFERFLPDEKRTKRLGNVVRPEEILALRGDADRGKRLFFEAAGVACRTCHLIAGQGGEVGPDLSEIGKKYDRAKILESILEPSKEIDPKFRTQLVATKAGQVLTGVLVDRTADKVTLRDAQNKLIELAAGDVEQLIAQQLSIMPDLLLRDMTAAQVADLVEYLASLR